MANNEKFINLLERLGRSAIHALYPNEVEYYFCALELLDSTGLTIDYAEGLWTWMGSVVDDDISSFNVTWLYPNKTIWTSQL